MDMDMVMDTVTGMDMAMVMATVDIIMERDLLKILRRQWFMSYLKDLPMLDMAMVMVMDMAMDMVTDMAMVMVDIVTVMVTMAMDTMEVIISPVFISYHYLLYQFNETHETRSDQEKYREHFCRKKRFYNSPLPFLTRTLNQL